MSVDLAPGPTVLADMHHSGGSPRDLIPEQILALRDLFLDRDVGLYLFAREIFGFKDLAPRIHGPICHLVGHWGETHLRSEDGSIQVLDRHPYEGEQVVDSYRRIMVGIPREFFKTSLLTRANALWTLAHDSNRTIGIFNEKEDNAQSWIAAICQVVENSILFQALWRDIIPRGVGFWDKDQGVSRNRQHKWGGTGMLMERDSHGISELSIEPHGIGGAATGKHYTHKILDDIIGLAAAKSPAVMQAAFDWVDNARPLERPAEQGCELVNHTTWTHFDVYRHMREKWPGEYKVYYRSLLENPDTGEPDDVHGRSIFPEKIPTDKAFAMQEADPFVFSAQYMLRPKAGRETSFDPAWQRRFQILYSGPEPILRITDDTYDPNLFDLETEDEFAPQFVPLHWCSKAIVLDPAPGKQSEINRDPRARNGITVGALDPWGRIFTLQALPLRADPVDVLRTLIELHRHWHPDFIAIEEVNFSAVYAPLWRRIMELDPAYQDVAPQFTATYPKGRDKFQRIRDKLIPRYRSGRGYINATGCEYLVKEMDDFPYGETVDLLDADSYLDEVISRPDTPDEMERRERDQRSTFQERGVTGYGW